MNCFCYLVSNDNDDDGDDTPEYVVYCWDMALVCGTS